MFHFTGEGPNSGDHRGRDDIEAALITNFELTGGTQKLDIHSISGLTKYAVRTGLTTAEPDR